MTFFSIASDASLKEFLGSVWPAHSTNNPPDVTVMVDWVSKIHLSNNVTLQNQTNMMQPVGQGDLLLVWL